MSGDKGSSNQGGSKPTTGGQSAGGKGTQTGPANGPSTTGNASGGGRGNNPPSTK